MAALTALPVCVALSGFLLGACAGGAPIHSVPKLSVDDLGGRTASFAGQQIRVEGFLGWRGEYVSMTDNRRPRCRSGGTEERILIVKGIGASELKRLGLEPFMPGRHVVLEGQFKNSISPLPLMVNGVSTMEWDAPYGPLVNSRIVSVFDDRCRTDPNTN